MRPFPIHIQTQSTECGLASMGMILAHFGRHVDIETLRGISGVSRDCVDAKDLLRIADHFGLSSRVVRTEPDRLHLLGFPLVVFTDFIHFTVVEAVDEREVLLADPGFGRHAIPREEFDECFTGVALVFTPSDRFRPGGKRVPLARRIARQLGYCPRGLLVVAIAAQAFWTLPLLPAILHLAGAGGGADEGFVRLGLSGLLAAGALLAIAAWSRAKIENCFSRNRLVGITRHILTRSHAFFVYRVHGVMAQRIGAQDVLAEILFRKLLPAAAAALAIPVLLGLLALAHPPSALVAVLLTGLHLGLNLLADRAAMREGRVRQDDRDAHWTKLSHSLENFESFKTSGGDREFFNDAMGLCARRIDIRQRTGLFRNAVELSSDLTFWLLLPALFVSFRVFPPSGGGWTTLLAVIGLVVLLHASLRAIARMHGSLDQLRFALPPLDDLADSIADPEEPVPTMVWPGNGSALTLRDVRFGFSPVKPPLFDRITVSIRPGEWVALTGPSGGGKSALAALMIGLHRPWSGSVEMDGCPISRIDRTDLARRIGWVDKHPFFAPGTIRDNIRLWDGSVTEADLAAAVADACLDDVVAGFPDGLDTPLAGRAANLSGGQRQRVEMARVLARNPGLVVIDEAKDGLDPDTERRLFDNLRRRGVTVLIVSHRTSTVAACDRIMRLSDGQLAPAETPEAARLCAAAGRDPFTPEVEEAAAAGGPDPAPQIEDLIAVFECVARAAGIVGISAPPSRAGTLSGEVLLTLARHNRLMMRPLRFAVADWWHRDHGPLIGFLKESGRPVAILPAPSGGSTVIDPRTGSVRTGDPADCLASTAYQLYPRFVPARVRLRDVFLTPLRPVGGWVAECALADILLAGMFIGGPVTALALADASVSLWLGGLALWVVAVMVLCATRLIAQHRIEGILELSAHAAIYQHLMRIQPLFIRKLAPQNVHRSLHAIPELLGLLRDGAARRLVLGLAALAGLAVIFHVAPALAGMAGLLLVPFALIPAGLILARSGPAAGLLRRRPANRVFLAALMKSAAKLRQSGRTEPAVAEWKRLVDAERELASRILNRETAAHDFLLWYLCVAAGWFAYQATGTAPVSTDQVVSAIVFLITAMAARQASDALCEIGRSGPALRHLQLLADAPVDPLPAAREAPADEENGGLELRRVRFRYPGAAHPAVRDVSLRVGPGEIVALTGPSGCGKSTLLRLVLGFHRPDSGEILRDGMPFDRIDISAWREGIGALLQDDELEQAKTIRGHIGGIDGQTLDGIREAARQAQLEADLDAMPMGIQTIVDSERISTGQKQRILIARRLLRKPKLLILDEATNALPDAMQTAIFAALRASGISCLVVSHRASALVLCDRVYRMDHGSLVEESASPAIAVPDPLPERTPEWTP